MLIFFYLFFYFFFRYFFLYFLINNIFFTVFQQLYHNFFFICELSLFFFSFGFFIFGIFCFTILKKQIISIKQNYNQILVNFLQYCLFFSFIFLFFFSDFFNFFYVASHNYFYSHLFNSFFFFDIFQQSFCYFNLFNLQVTNLFAKFFYFLLLFTYFYKKLPFFSFYNYQKFEIFFLLFINIFAGSLLLISMNFLSIYLTLELFSLSLYPILAFKSLNYYTIEATLKYFIFNALSASFLLFGFAFFYGNLFHTQLYQYNYQGFDHFYVTNLFLYFSLLFILFSFLIKIASYPFHYWAPDVYDGTPIFFSGYLMIVVKFATTYIYIQIFKTYLFYLTSNLLYYYYFFLILGILSAIIGCFGGLLQLRIKRLLAYSSISQASFLLFSLASNFLLNNFFTFFFYLISYLLSLLLIFQILLNLYEKQSNRVIIFLSDLSGLFQYNALSALFLTIAFYSLSGLPPTLGFLAKYLIFEQLILLAENNSFYFVLLLLGLNLLSTFYYIKLLKIINMDSKSNLKFLTYYNLLPGNSLLAFFLFFGAFPGIYSIFYKFAQNLSNSFFFL